MSFSNIIELAQAKGGLVVIFNFFLVRIIVVFEYSKRFFLLILHQLPKHLTHKLYSILLKHLSCMLVIPKCAVIYYVIFIICLHYARKFKASFSLGPD